MKRKFVWLGLVTVVALVSWFVAAFRPAHSKIDELRDDVVATKQEVSSLQAKLQHLISLKHNEPKIRAEVERMTTALPNLDPKVSDFIVQVQDAANAAGIDFLTVTPSLPAVPDDIGTSATPAAPAPSTTKPSTSSSTEGAAAAPQAPQTPIRSISVQIKADGRFFELEQFVLKMEHLARALRIDELDLSAGGADKGGVLSASMKVRIFMLAPQAAAGGSTSQTAQGTTGAA
jgi:Tfp pilus assembly protein PilO